MKNKILKPFLSGSAATSILLGIYFSVLSMISGWDFAQSQFSRFWYFIVSLAIGFGIQIGLYVYLKNIIHRQNGTGKVLAASGTTSTLSMVSCCAHYLANIFPIIATTGITAIISQYQIGFLWFGLVSNLAGIAYISVIIIKFNKKL